MDSDYKNTGRKTSVVSVRGRGHFLIGHKQAHVFADKLVQLILEIEIKVCSEGGLDDGRE